MAMSKKLYMKTEYKSEETEPFINHIKLMKKWIQSMDTETKYLQINVTHEIVNSQLGNALSLLRKHLQTTPVRLRRFISF
jgi:hypothetical protein